MNVWLRWLTPILAMLTALFAAGHLGQHFDLSWLVLVSAFVTAVIGFIVALQKSAPAEDAEPAKPVQPVPPKPK